MTYKGFWSVREYGGTLLCWYMSTYYHSPYFAYVGTLSLNKLLDFFTITVIIMIIITTVMITGNLAGRELNSFAVIFQDRGSRKVIT